MAEWSENRTLPTKDKFYMCDCSQLALLQWVIKGGVSHQVIPTSLFKKLKNVPSPSVPWVLQSSVDFGCPTNNSPSLAAGNGTERPGLLKSLQTSWSRLGFHQGSLQPLGILGAQGSRSDLKAHRNIFCCVPPQKATCWHCESWCKIVLSWWRVKINSESQEVKHSIGFQQ